MSALETVVVVLAALTLVYLTAAVLGLFGPDPRERMNQSRMHQADVVDTDARPSEDEVDPPLPHRRLRGRPSPANRGPGGA